MDTEDVNRLLQCLMRNTYYELSGLEFINWTGFHSKLDDQVFDDIERKIHDAEVIKIEGMTEIDPIIKSDFSEKVLQLL